jgi:hypothetical protein
MRVHSRALAEMNKHENDMRTYKIRDVNNNGNLIGEILAAHADGKQASIFADAMTLRRPYERTELWEDDALIYERPHRHLTPKLH